MGFSGEKNKVEIALIGPFFNTKTTIRRENVYFDFDRTERMGGRYNLEVQLYPTNNENSVEYRLPMIQFIVDDELSTCTPFLEYSTSQSSKR